MRRGHDDDKSILKSEKKASPYFIYILTLLCAIGGFLFGYDTGVISGAVVLIRRQFRLNEKWQHLIGCGAILSAWLFSYVAGFLIDRVGRKLMILVASFIFTAGSVIMAISNSKELLLLGRFIVGVGIGFQTTTVPLYIAEVSITPIRGQLITLVAVMVAAGQLTAAVLTGIFSHDVTTGWRYMLGLSGLTSLVQFIGFLGMPESPRWLVAKGRVIQAEKVLRSIRSSGGVEEELDSVKNQCEQERNEYSGLLAVPRILKSPTVYRAVVLGCLLQIFHQLAGINVVTYYSRAIVQMSGVTDTSLTIWVSAAAAFVNFSFTFIGLFAVERIGRRPLLLVSLAGVVFSLFVLGIGFQMVSMYSPAVRVHETTENSCGNYGTCSSCVENSKCGFCYTDNTTDPTDGSCMVANVYGDGATQGRCARLDNTTTDLIFSYGYCPSSMAVLPILGLVSYILCFAPGMGTMPWTINAEIYPNWARGTALAISSSCYWMVNLAVFISIPTLTQLLTKYGLFYLYGTLALVGWIYFYCFVPETKGTSMEEVEGLFPQWLWIGRAKITGENRIQYVHIRGLNRDRQESNDSMDED